MGNTDYTLLDSRKREVIEDLQRQGLPPGEFEFRDDSDSRLGRHRVTKLVHRPTDYHFLFDYSTGAGCLCHEFTPGENNRKLVFGRSGT